MQDGYVAANRSSYNVHRGHLALFILTLVAALLLGYSIAKATSKSTNCVYDVTCYGQTSWWTYNGDYHSNGTSSAWDSYGAINLYYLSASTRGTNSYHSGEIFDYHQCGVYNGNTCTTAALILCDTGGVVCGPNDTANWYATTLNYFSYPSWGLSESFYTASVSGRDSAYCYTSMACF